LPKIEIGASTRADNRENNRTKKKAILQARWFDECTNFGRILQEELLITAWKVAWKEDFKKSHFQEETLHLCPLVA
jgi:hypothetical protein